MREERKQNRAETAGIKLCGEAKETIDWVEKHQLLDRRLWRQFVRQFRTHPDSANSGWRGEYWGKMMRGAVMVYRYTENKRLYEILTETVEDLLTTQNSDGSFSTYLPETQFRHWDMWCRKYVMLGLEHYLEICTDEDLQNRILSALCAHADAILCHIGEKSEGKIPVTDTSGIYGGMNSASILEPMVWLYRLTGAERYLTFARHILSTGGCRFANIFQLAYEDEIAPYAYGVNKAYEMMSCFEGLLEYYEVTGEEYWRDSAIRFARKVMETDVTVIGCCGTQSELFDHSAVRQTGKPEGVLQETCVSVTWMKLCKRLFEVTGDAVFLDAVEKTYYNAYLSTLNTEGCHAKNERLKYKVLKGCVPTVMPFDSYSPLIPGIRGEETGGAQMFDDRSYYGCCACIASAGAAIYPQSMLWSTDKGELLLTQYEKGSVTVILPSGRKAEIEISGNYPCAGTIVIRFRMEQPAHFTFGVRIPAWSKKSSVLLNGVEREVSSGLEWMERDWCNGDLLELKLDFGVYAERAPQYESDVLYQIDWSNGEMYPKTVYQNPEARNYISFRRGPLTLAVDNRSGRDAEQAVTVGLQTGDRVQAEEVHTDEAPYPCMSACRLRLGEETVLLTDYASVGRLWNEISKSAAWIPAVFSEKEGESACDRI